MSKRTYGHGSVCHRADGRWEAQFRLATGGRASFYGRSRQEALAKLEAVQAGPKINRWRLPVSSRNRTAGDAFRNESQGTSLATTAAHVAAPDGSGLDTTCELW